ncbi:hypothetical protein ACOMHN_037225 [Nucella lapillus]
MDLVHNVTSWPEGLNNDSAAESDQFFNKGNVQYRLRNGVLGALGILLNLLVLPVIYVNDDLPVYLKATFCCMVAGDLVAMATVQAGFCIGHITPEITRSIFLAGNINCMVMVAIAVERVLTLRNPNLFRRLFGKSKVKVALVTPLVLQGSGIMVTLPLLVSHGDHLGSMSVDVEPSNSHRYYTPLSTMTGAAVIMEAGVVIVSSLTVCVVYSFLAHTLMRTTASTLLPAPSTASTIDQDMGTSSARSCGTTQPDPANLGAPGSEPHSGGTSSTECSHSTAPHVHITTRQMRRFRRATVHSAVLAAWFFLAYAPFGFYYLWVLLSGTDRAEESKTVRITVMSSLPLANSLVDPILLLWRLFPFSDLASRVQTIVLQGVGHVFELRHHVSQILAGAWSSLRTSCRRGRRRRNRVESLPADPSQPYALRGKLRTILVNGPSCSTRTIQVQEAPTRKKVRLKTDSTSSSSPGEVCWKIGRIEEQSEDMVV